MDYKRLTIHPANDDAGAEIGEAVHNLGGTLVERKLLGMLHYEGLFADGGQAAKALELLQTMDCVSNVGWIETT